MYLYWMKNNQIVQTLRLTIVSRNAYEKFTVTTAGETEEDRLLDEKEAKTNKKLDTVLTWVMTAVFIAVFVYLGIKIFG